MAVLIQKYPNIRKGKTKLSDAMVWTEIFSVIKGGFKSNSHYYGYLPAGVYINKEGSIQLTSKERS